MDAGEERIENQKTIESLRAKAKRINRRALITAIVITLVVFVFPSRFELNESEPPSTEGGSEQMQIASRFFDEHERTIETGGFRKTKALTVSPLRKLASSHSVDFNLFSAKRPQPEAKRDEQQAEDDGISRDQPQNG